MGIVNVKDINKELRCALKCFNNAVKMARNNLVVGEVNIAAPPQLKRKVKKGGTCTPVDTTDSQPTNIG